MAEEMPCGSLSETPPLTRFEARRKSFSEMFEFSRLSPSALFSPKAAKKRSRSGEARFRLEEELTVALKDLDRRQGEAMKKEVVELAEVAKSALRCVGDLSLDDRARIVQDAYAAVERRLSPMTEVDHVTVVESFERCICESAYSLLFTSQSNSADAVDMSLSDRIRSLRWVTAGFLETGLNPTLPAVSDRIHEAIKELLSMDRPRCPRDKLECVLKASNQLLQALRHSLDGRLACADDFLPALIYTVLKGNPPRLQSNLDFIARFACPYNTTFGELGYYFTSLVSAKTYIQNLAPGDLDVPKEDFDAYTFSCSPSCLTIESRFTFESGGESESEPPPTPNYGDTMLFDFELELEERELRI